MSLVRGRVNTRAGQLRIDELRGATVTGDQRREVGLQGPPDHLTVNVGE
jgi:hypothetical protein